MGPAVSLVTSSRRRHGNVELGEKAVDILNPTLRPKYHHLSTGWSCTEGTAEAPKNPSLDRRHIFQSLRKAHMQGLELSFADLVVGLTTATVGAMAT